jgi:2-oxoglutarate ferredoxin oxidoreductase subunit delta
LNIRKIIDMPRIEIDESRCKGCGLCTITCPGGLISLTGKKNLLGYSSAVITDMDGCEGCKTCAEICPDLAILVFK